MYTSLQALNPKPQSQLLTGPQQFLHLPERHSICTVVVCDVLWRFCSWRAEGFRRVQGIGFTV